MTRIAAPAFRQQCARFAASSARLQASLRRERAQYRIADLLVLTTVVGCSSGLWRADEQLGLHPHLVRSLLAGCAIGVVTGAFTGRLGRTLLASVAGALVGVVVGWPYAAWADGAWVVTPLYLLASIYGVSLAAAWESDDDGLYFAPAIAGGIAAFLPGAAFLVRTAVWGAYEASLAGALGGLLLLGLVLGLSTCLAAITFGAGAGVGLAALRLRALGRAISSRK